jgi:hypothetical protein
LQSVHGLGQLHEQASSVEQVADAQNNVLTIERLEKEVIGAEKERALSTGARFSVAVAGSVQGSAFCRSLY